MEQPWQGRSKRSQTFHHPLINRRVLAKRSECSEHQPATVIDVQVWGNTFEPRVRFHSDHHCAWIVGGAWSEAPSPDAAPSSPPTPLVVPHAPALPAGPLVAPQPTAARGGRCCVIDCTDVADREHPIVRGAMVCGRHQQRLLSNEQRKTKGVCPAVRQSRVCESRGCQLGESRPCSLCGAVSSALPCAYPGCSSYMCPGCRAWLGRRVHVYWSGPRKWYWGTVKDAASTTGERLVCYDDGDDREEDVVGLERAGQLQWLIRDRTWHDQMPPCICYPGVAKLDSKLVDAMWTCAVCRTYDTNMDEHGAKNVMVLCDHCQMPVHIFCYGQTQHGDEFRSNNAESMQFTCDVCNHRKAGGKPPTCDICVRGGGALRQHFDAKGQPKGWMHVGCVWYNPRVQWPVAKQQRCVPDVLCARKSGCVRCLRSRVELKQLSKAASRAVSKRCAVGGCPDPEQNCNALVQCGGCKKSAHVSCAQAIRSGWHIQFGLDTQEDGAVEITCPKCCDVYLDRTTDPPRYVQAGAMGRPGLQDVTVASFVTDSQYAAAEWTLQDWAHGPCGGFTLVGRRLGGLCTNACDIDETARAAYVATFRRCSHVNISDMARDTHRADLVMISPACSPFNPRGLQEGFEHVAYGNNWQLIAAALKGRRGAGVFDRGVLIENVPQLLSFLDESMLADLGLFHRIFVVSGAHFGCANVRERFVFVGFYEQQHLDNFSPPPAWTSTAAPIGSVLSPFTEHAGQSLMVKPSQLRHSANGDTTQTGPQRNQGYAHVVSATGCAPLSASPRAHLAANISRASATLTVEPAASLADSGGARSPVCSYGSPGSPGTLICTNPRFATIDRALTNDEIRSLDTFGDVRKLHPDEILASFSFRRDELPRLTGGLGDQYKAVSQTICLNVFEAFSAEILHAMGISGPRERLHDRLKAEYPGMRNVHAVLEERRDRTSGIEYLKYRAPSDVLPEDELSEYELKRKERMDSNRRYFDALEGAASSAGPSEYLALGEDTAPDAPG